MCPAWILYPVLFTAQASVLVCDEPVAILLNKQAWRSLQSRADVPALVPKPSEIWAQQRNLRICMVSSYIQTLGFSETRLIYCTMYLSPLDGECGLVNGCQIQVYPAQGQAVIFVS